MNGKERCMEGKYEDIDDRKKGNDLDGKNGRKEKITKWKRGSKKGMNGKQGRSEDKKKGRNERRVEARKEEMKYQKKERKGRL